jgi:hypothetical protein
MQAGQGDILHMLTSPGDPRIMLTNTEPGAGSCWLEIASSSGAIQSKHVALALMTDATQTANC